MLPGAALVGQLAALATAGLWSTTAMLFEGAGRRVGSRVVNLTRLLLALGILLAVHQLLFGQPVPWDAGSSAWGWLALSALLGLVIGDGALFQSYLMIGPRQAMLIMSTAPMWAALAAWPIFGESLGLRELAGMALTLGGVAFVLTEDRRPRPRDTDLAAAEATADGPSTGARERVMDRAEADVDSPASLRSSRPEPPTDARGQPGSPVALPVADPLDLPPAGRREGAPWAASAPNAAAPDSTRPVGAASGPTDGVAAGAALAMVGALGQAGNLITAKMGMAGGLSPFSATTARMAVAVLVLWGAAAFRGELRATVGRWSDRRAFQLIAAGTIVGPVLGVWLSLVAVQAARVGVAATLMALPPVLLIPMERVVHGRRTGARGIIGAIAAIAGVALLVGA